MKKLVKFLCGLTIGLVSSCLVAPPAFLVLVGLSLSSPLPLPLCNNTLPVSLPSLSAGITICYRKKQECSDLSPLSLLLSQLFAE